LLLPEKKLEITILAIWLSAMRTTMTYAAISTIATSIEPLSYLWPSALFLAGSSCFFVI